MTTAALRTDSLVLYKNRPARITTLSDKKIEIQAEGGENISVRPKDVTLLHPGPLRSLNDLKPLKGEVNAAWELLAGETTTLPELAELAYSAYTPVTAWATYQLLHDGLYFSGEPEQISVHTAEKVASIQAGRDAKAAEERAWSAFLARVQVGQVIPADERYLADVVALALEQREQSRILRSLGREETPQNAHALLLNTGYWAPTVNPYPQRLRIPTTIPDAPLPALPDEARRDLTHLTAFAIDDEGAQDPDDAISWDGEHLWVHVADVAALVPPDSPADAEARVRGANLYLPEETVPMLPPSATDQLGLGLQEVSPALSFCLSLTETGELGPVEIMPSWVRVTRMTYEMVEDQLYDAPFNAILKLTDRYAIRRLRNGALELNLPEVKLRVVDGQVSIKPLPRLRSRDLVREAMLMTGEAVARYAAEQKLAIPFSTQEIGEEFEGEMPETLSGMFALRRLLKPSQHKSAAAPHAGLGMERYVQATSPLRRYTDLLAHQQLRAHLRGETPLDAKQMMERIAEASQGMGATRRAERISNNHWRLVFLLQHPNWSGEGIVVEKVAARNLLLIPELALETEIYGRPDLPLDEPLRVQWSEINLPMLESRFRVLKS